jgi:NDP-sugar pyrophosphorylase family protein
MKAVILAGGLGTRLKPFTQAIPKPLLPIGEQSLLEIQIRNLVKHGFDEVFICTNYKADYVESFIGDGGRLGARVRFSREKIPLGTCGPLSLLRGELREPFLMMNGDILTTCDFRKFYDFADAQGFDFTIATKKIRTPFNYGSVEAEGNRVVRMEEKPDFILEIVAGIYYMRPALYRHVPEDTYFGIDDLVGLMLERGEPIGRYLLSEYWLDLGQIDDYSQAEAAYRDHFEPAPSRSAG